MAQETFSIKVNSDNDPRLYALLKEAKENKELADIIKNALRKYYFSMEGKK